MSRFNGKRAEFEASGEKINVAILGAGRIAHTMAGTLTQMAEDSLYSSWIHPYAVAARDITRAQAFADQWHFDKAYGSYEELVADPDVDLVYIATPHSLHAEQAILCMKAGKNVLVEKRSPRTPGRHVRRWPWPRKPACCARRPSGRATCPAASSSTKLSSPARSAR